MPCEKNYQKLVRDKIPEIIESSGAHCEIDILLPIAYQQALDNKLKEEVDEYFTDKTLEELVDISEVLDAIIVSRGYTMKEFAELKKEKAKNKGRFKKRIFLKSVIDGKKEEN